MLAELLAAIEGTRRAPRFGMYSFEAITVEQLATASFPAISSSARTTELW